MKNKGRMYIDLPAQKWYVRIPIIIILAIPMLAAVLLLSLWDVICNVWERILWYLESPIASVKFWWKEFIVDCIRGNK